MSELDWRISDARDLAARSGEWDRLVASRGYPPFLRSAFLLPALETFGAGSEVLALGYAAEELTCGAILKRAGIGRWSVFQPSQLPLGTWIGTDPGGCERMLAGLARALPGPVFVIGATQLDPRFVERPNLESGLETLDYVATGWIDVDRTFEDFWQARGKNLRQNLRKQRRKLEEQGTPLAFEAVTEAAGIDAVFCDFASLESHGWKADAGSAIALDNPQGAFYRRMLAAFSRDGSAIAYRLSLSGRPIAVDFGVRDGRSVVILKTTYDEAMKGVSPAQLLHEQIFQHHFTARDVARIEFYGKMMEWHTRWTDQSRMLFHINYFGAPGVRILRNGLKALASAGGRRAS